MGNIKGKGRGNSALFPYVIRSGESFLRSALSGRRRPCGYRKRWSTSDAGLPGWRGLPLRTAKGAWDDEAWPEHSFVDSGSVFGVRWTLSNEAAVFVALCIHRHQVMPMPFPVSGQQ